ncbi:MAG: repressor LexA [Alphaproteobacteria bacterium]|jgi:repressor LexA|nr:repressor LexA [Alphaproteobacteria bacterium]PPR12679.1 MAG: LexA repressor [Alphaproteobacteria bacterium MarineAlpha12_Bin1]|tara:strand:+ start:1800 stop:2489 length:690 start_codon:yes stop_codon:yes gene_type:complete
MLTRKQHELLLFINKKLLETGVAPSFDEMKEALSLKSKSGIHRLISGLEERRFIARLPHRARALEVLRLPDDVSITSDQKFSPRVIQGGIDLNKRKTTKKFKTSTQVPMLGRIAAGTPIEALTDPTHFISIPSDLLGRGEYYCLEVDGDSMIEAGILDGDTVLIERTDIAENGTIVVALVEGNEVTLKRLRKRHNSVALEPANTNYETRIFGPDQVEIQGKLRGLVRSY